MEDNTVTFCVIEEGTPKEVLRLDANGFVYLGRRIEDAGEAHKIWLEVMGQMKLQGDKQCH